MPGRRPLLDVPIVSTVHWVMLALVIEKPSYGYEIAVRYDRRFGLFLPTSKTSIYGSLDQLEYAGLVERLPLELAPAGGRRPRTIYRSTSEAKLTHLRWLSSPVAVERWHTELLARIGAAHLHGAQTMLEMLDRYAQHAEQHQRRLQQLSSEREVAEQQTLLARSAILLLTEQQDATTARIHWANNAREEIERLASGR